MMLKVASNSFGPESAFLQDALLSLLEGTTELPASELTRVVNVAGKVLGAERARVLVADYALVWLQQLGEDGPTGDATVDRGHAGRSCVRTRRGRRVGERADPRLGPPDRGKRTTWGPGALLRVLDRRCACSARSGGARPGARVDQQAALHGCSTAGTATRTAVDCGRVAVGLATSVDVLDGARVGERHPRTCVLDRRRLVRLRDEPGSARSSRSSTRSVMGCPQ